MEKLHIYVAIHLIKLLKHIIKISNNIHDIYDTYNIDIGKR